MSCAYVCASCRRQLKRAVLDRRQQYARSASFISSSNTGKPPARRDGEDEEQEIAGGDKNVREVGLQPRLSSVEDDFLERVMNGRQSHRGPYSSPRPRRAAAERQDHFLSNVIPVREVPKVSFRFFKSNDGKNQTVPDRARAFKEFAGQNTSSLSRRMISSSLIPSRGPDSERGTGSGRTTEAKEAEQSIAGKTRHDRLSKPDSSAGAEGFGSVPPLSIITNGHASTEQIWEAFLRIVSTDVSLLRNNPDAVQTVIQRTAMFWGLVFPEGFRLTPWAVYDRFDALSIPYSQGLRRRSMYFLLKGIARQYNGIADTKAPSLNALCAELSVFWSDFVTSQTRLDLMRSKPGEPSLRRLSAQTKGAEAWTALTKSCEKEALRISSLMTFRERFDFCFPGNDYSKPGSLDWAALASYAFLRNQLESHTGHDAAAMRSFVLFVDSLRQDANMSDYLKHDNVAFDPLYASDVVNIRKVIKKALKMPQLSRLLPQINPMDDDSARIDAVTQSKAYPAPNPVRETSREHLFQRSGQGSRADANEPPKIASLEDVVIREQPTKPYSTTEEVPVTLAGTVRGKTQSLHRKSMPSPASHVEKLSQDRKKQADFSTGEFHTSEKGEQRPSQQQRPKSERDRISRDMTEKRVGRAIEQKDPIMLERLWRDAQADRIFDESPSVTSTGYSKTKQLYGLFLMGFMRLRRPEGAIHVWNTMDKQSIAPTLSMWDTMIRGFGKLRDGKAAETMWTKALAAGVQPDQRLWAGRIQALTTTQYWLPGMKAYEEMMHAWIEAAQRELPPNPSHSAVAALGNLKGVPKPNVEALNALLPGLARARKIDLIQDALRWSRSLGIPPDVYSYNAILKYALADDDEVQVRSLLDEMKAGGVQPDAATISMLLESLFRNSSYDTAEQTSERHAAARDMLRDATSYGVQLTPHTFSTIVSGLLRTGTGKGTAHDAPVVTQSTSAANAAAAYSVVQHMLAHNIPISSAVYTSLVTHHLSSRPPDVAAAEELWSRMRADKSHVPDAIFFDRLIEGFATLRLAPRVKAALAHAGQKARTPGWIALRAAVVCLAEAGDREAVQLLLADVKREEAGGRLIRHRMGKKWFLDTVDELGFDTTGIGRMVEE